MSASTLSQSFTVIKDSIQLYLHGYPVDDFFRLWKDSLIGSIFPFSYSLLTFL